MSISHGAQRSTRNLPGLVSGFMTRDHWLMMGGICPITTSGVHVREAHHVEHMYICLSLTRSRLLSLPPAR